MRTVVAATLAAGAFAATAACAAPSTTYAGAGERPSAPDGAFAARVVRVVDGDTFVARRDGRDLRVRLIGIDAPESVKPGAPVGCFGPEASRVLRRLLPAGSPVRAAYEPGGRRDRFGRDLWDVWLPDGRFVQAVLVERGAARARRYLPQQTYAALLARLGERAARRGAGLWGACG